MGDNTCAEAKVLCGRKTLDDTVLRRTLRRIEIPSIQLESTSARSSLATVVPT